MWYRLRGIVAPEREAEHERERGRDGEDGRSEKGREGKKETGENEATQINGGSLHLRGGDAPLSIFLEII